MSDFTAFCTEEWPVSMMAMISGCISRMWESSSVPSASGRLISRIAALKKRSFSWDIASAAEGTVTTSKPFFHRMRPMIPRKSWSSSTTSMLSLASIDSPGTA